MAINIAVATLLKEKRLLQEEKRVINERLDEQISQYNTAIETISGKTVWEIEQEIVYDDENPDYIKGSQEEI